MRQVRPFLCVLMLTGAALAGAGAPASAAAPVPRCKVEFLPTPSYTVQSGVIGGDRSGRFAVGSALVDPGEKSSRVALIWENGQQRAVTLPYPQAVLTDINASGVAVGTGTDAAGRRHAFVLDGGVVRELPSPNPAYETSAVAINDRGDVAGEIHDPPGGWIERAVRWPAGNAGIVEEVPVKGTVSALGISKDGTVLAQPGGSFTPGPAIAWGAGDDVVELAAPGGGTSIGIAITGYWVTGWENGPSGTSSALRWSLRSGSVTTMDGVYDPRDVNTAGDVGGQDAGFTPVIHKANGTVVRPQVPDGDRGGVVVLSDRRVAYGFVEGQAVRWTGC